MLTFQWLLSQIGGVGSMTGSAGNMERILTQVDTAGGLIWLDDVEISVSQAETFLGTKWPESATNKLIIVGSETSNDPFLAASLVIKFVG